MSSTPSSTMPPPDVPTSQGEQRVRPVQKLLLIILITACIVLVGGVALLYYLSKSKDAGTQVASQSVPVDYKCGPRPGAVLHQPVPTFGYTVAIPSCR
jgi:flagellar basal body-associated protein FliL